MYVIRGWGIVLQKGLFLRGLGLGNCTDWLRLSVLNPARRDLRCLSHFIITGVPFAHSYFFALQYSDSNHSANFFAPLLVLHRPQHLTMSISGGRMLLYRMNCSVRSSKKARERQLQRFLDYPWDAFGTPCGSFCLRDSLGAQGNRFRP